MTDFWVYVFGDRGQTIIAGALGGMVKWLSLRDHWSDGIIAIIVGAICAVYLSPLALPIMDPVLKVVIDNYQQRATLSGFVIGIGGIGVVGLIMDVLKLRRQQIGGGDASRKPDEMG